MFWDLWELYAPSLDFWNQQGKILYFIVLYNLINLLIINRGRLIFLGDGHKGDGLVAFATSRAAIEGCVEALREELKPYGVSVISLDSEGVPAESLFKAPVPYSKLLKPLIFFEY